MQYVCRSCFLRLGQPWRQPIFTTPRPLSPRRALPLRATRQASQSTASYDQTLIREGHERPLQQPFDSALTTTEGRTPASGLPSHGHTVRRPGGEDTPGVGNAPRRSSETRVPLTKVPKPRSRVTPSTSTFTTKDSRVQFIKEFDMLDENSWDYAKVLRRFAEWELFQRERLEKSIGPRVRHTVFAAFGAWKDVMKNAHSCPSKGLEPELAADRRVLQWMRDCESLEAMMATMPRFSAAGYKWHRRMESDRLLLSVAMLYAPDRLCWVLESVLRSQVKGGAPHFFVVEDVLGWLAMRLQRTESDKKQPFAEQLADLVLLALETIGTNPFQGGIQISQATIYSTLTALPPTAVESWYHRLRGANCHLFPFTKLHFATRIARYSPRHKMLSIDILQELKNIGLLKINSPLAASICTSILSFNKDGLAQLDDQSATPADLFGLLHELGFTPNVITYSAIIRGLCLKKDLTTALEIFEIMKHHGVEPDEFTYSILINGCKKCGDFKRMADFATMAYNAKVRDTVVWNDVLHGVFTCCRQTRKAKRAVRRTSLYAMNVLYSRLFDVEPIKPFITSRLAEMGNEQAPYFKWIPEEFQWMYAATRVWSSASVLKPDTATLSVMLLSLVQALPLPHDLIAFYHNYREMLDQGHPVARQLVQERGTFLHDIILRNLMKWQGTMRVCLEIIKDMMREVGKGADHAVMRSPLKEATAEPLDPAPPTGTARSLEAEDGQSSDSRGTVMDTSSTSTSGQEPTTTQANKDERTPQRSPIRHPAPSIYTWSILMYGFMRHKHPREAESILTLMSEHGLKPTIVTFNTLAAGYAKLQKIPQAVKMMQHLEAEGFQADDWTLRAFSYVGNKDRAIKLMEATVEENRAKQAELQAQAAIEAQVAKTGEQETELATELATEQDEVLDQDLEALLEESDPGHFPEHISKEIHGGLQGAMENAPLTDKSKPAEWAKELDQDMDATSVTPGPESQDTAQNM